MRRHPRLRAFEPLVEHLGLLELRRQVLAMEAETPVEADDKGAEGDNGQRLEEVAPREQVALHPTA